MSFITTIFHRFKVNNEWFKNNNRDFLHRNHGAWEKEGTHPCVLPILHLSLFSSVLEKLLFLFKSPPAHFLLFALTCLFLPFIQTCCCNASQATWNCEKWIHAASHLSAQFLNKRKIKTITLFQMKKIWVNYLHFFLIFLLFMQVLSPLLTPSLEFLLSIYNNLHLKLRKTNCPNCWACSWEWLCQNKLFFSLFRI